jgi:hypothetical protein
VVGEDEAVKGVVPVGSTVQDEKTLSEGGINQNIIYVRGGGKEVYVGGRYPVNCTSGIISSMDMWVQGLMTMVRGVNLTLTYGHPKGDGCRDKWPKCGWCVCSESISWAFEGQHGGCWHGGVGPCGIGVGCRGCP